MDSEKFNLSWNEFESCASNAIRGLFSDRNFTDVTLACDDNKQISAHKVVLSACSPFFRRILVSNPHQHPLIYLKGIKYDDLQSVMKFVYLGESEVGQGDLETFLSTAKDLEIKGLSDNEIERSPAPQHKIKEYQEGSDKAFVVKDSIIGKYEDEIVENENCNTEEMIPSIQDIRFKGNSSEMIPYEELSSITRENGKLPCDKCEYQADRAFELIRHKQAKHEGVKYQCNFCEQSYSFKSAVNRHQKNAHSNIN